MNLEELSKDQELKNRIENAESLAEVVEIFREKGIEVTEAQLEAAMKDTSDEISESDLQNVAGGIKLWPWPGFPYIPGIFPPKRPGWPWKKRR